MMKDLRFHGGWNVGRRAGDVTHRKATSQKVCSTRIKSLIQYCKARPANTAIMDQRVKEVAKEDADRLKHLTMQAVQSRAYLYPFKACSFATLACYIADQQQGLFFFATHRELWRPLMAKLVPTVTTGVSVTTAMFIFAYLPQAAVLTIFNGPLAIVSTIMLVLSESSTITNILARNFFIQDALLDTFDAVSK
jgi:hypothetical protein